MFPASETHQVSQTAAGLTTKEVVGICAVCVGVGVVGGLAVATFGSALVAVAGRAAMGSLASAALGGLGRPVFTGPRGGRFVITKSGLKSYMVP